MKSAVGTVAAILCAVVLATVGILFAVGINKTEMLWLSGALAVLSLGGEGAHASYQKTSDQPKSIIWYRFCTIVLWVTIAGIAVIVVAWLLEPLIYAFLAGGTEIVPKPDVPPT